MQFSNFMSGYIGNHHHGVNQNKGFLFIVVPTEWFLSLEHDSPSLVTQEHLAKYNPASIRKYTNYIV
jgi:hypothetical protein